MEISSRSEVSTCFHGFHVSQRAVDALDFFPVADACSARRGKEGTDGAMEPGCASFVTNICIYTYMYT